MDYEFFMGKAIEEARQALNIGEFPVGCVMVCDDRVLVTGTRRHSAPDKHNELDHAEMLALRRLIDLEQKVNRSKIAVFSTLEPCLMCYSALIVNGIRTIVYAYEDVLGGGTKVDLTNLNLFYREMKVSIVEGVLRHESLGLFKDFFSDPNNNYLRGTLLAEHATNEELSESC